ncbi:MAG: sugar transferase [Verrucomicrobia bacterium]|nr:sugar transferase [Verrucomicrobiota bacterium]
MKRAIDLTLVLLSAPAWVPVLLALAAVVRVRLGAPVFFTQERAGWKGRCFRVVKFRTMTDERDSEGKLLPDDQRLTAFGRWLRATSLDELPELWNILKGDMSLVGPRPLLAKYLPRYSVEQRRRHEVRPGLTGWAQINGRNALGWDERFALDVWYVDHRTLALDLKILLLTLQKVVRRDGISAPGEATMPEFLGPRGQSPVVGPVGGRGSAVLNDGASH